MLHHKRSGATAPVRALGRFGVLLAILVVTLARCGSGGIPGQAATQRVPATPASPWQCTLPAASPLKVIHFFDWYSIDTINGPRWTHKIDWASYGLSEDEVGTSKAYYDSQFKLISELGVDGITYEYYEEAGGGGWPKLGPNFLASLQEHKIKVGLFYDWEIQQVGAIGPVLSEKGYIQPTAASAAELIRTMSEFYQRIPRESWLLDGDQNLPIMIFGFGFDTASTDDEAWHTFYSSILAGLEQQLGIKPVLYWTAINKLQLEYAFLHFPDQIRPFNFVLDNPQPQLAPGAVTWNINFDNLGIYRVDKMQRVVRDDPRYIQEMLWLARHTDPDLVFIYSWNEFYEGANIMPDTTYGTKRYEFMQALLRDIARPPAAPLPCTLLIVDDYSDIWEVDDWHLNLAEQFTIYPLRRYAPQADVRLASEVTPELLKRYDLIISTSTQDANVYVMLEPLMDTKQVVLIGPKMAYMESLRSRFTTSVATVGRNRNVGLVDASGKDTGPLFVRDDVLTVDPAAGAATLATVRDGETSIPVILRAQNDWWINAYVPDDRLLQPVFEGVYGRVLEPGIMYGEGMRSQRLEVAPDGTVTQNTFAAPAVYQHEPLPLEWQAPPPQEVPGK